MAYEYQAYPRYLYHHKLAREGRVFNSAAETKGLKGKGWVDTPAKFPKPSRLAGALRRVKPWWSEWSWTFQLVAAILVIVAAAIKIWLR